MPFVLTTKSQITCRHQGQVKVESSEKLRVDKNPVLIESSVVGKTILGCKTPPSDKSQPCKEVTADAPSVITAGRSAKLYVRGQPVLLETLEGMTNGMEGGVTPQSLSKSIAGQAKLSAD